jgi:hypothetical protein
MLDRFHRIIPSRVTYWRRPGGTCGIPRAGLSVGIDGCGHRVRILGHDFMASPIGERGMPHLLAD